MTPSVSIVIPTKNRVAHLARCLDTLLEQQYPDPGFEIIIVDDRSTDQTPGLVSERCARFAECNRPLRYLLNGRRGTNAAVNAGVEAASGEVIVTIGDDTLVPPHWLLSLVRGLLESEAEIATGPLRIPLPGPLLGKHREEVAGYLTEVLTPVRWNGLLVPVAGNMAVKRSAYERALFDETLRPPVEEVDWVLKARGCCVFVPEAWAWHDRTPEELYWQRVVRLAWRRGSEGGWWLRSRLKLPSHERLQLAFGSLKTSGRAFAHAAVQQCWGGVVVGMGEMAKALALVGLINRGARQPESWR